MLTSKEVITLKCPTKSEVRRSLHRLVELGLVKKEIRGGEEVFRADFSYVAKAKELIRKGVESHEAYLRAILEQAPGLCMKDALTIVAEHVHTSYDRQKISLFAGKCD